jgi:hypothetical protein
MANRNARKKVDTSDMPYVENYPPLKAWLDKHDARCMFQVPMQCEHGRDGAPPTAYVEQYLFPRTNRFAVVVVQARKMGWDIYVSSNDPQINTTLEDAERRLGLTS